MTLEKNKLKLNSVLEFEIEAYKVESRLAAEKFAAEHKLREILNSKSWRYTEFIRKFIAYLVRPLTRTAKGINVLKRIYRRLP